ncbi:MAG: C25 family cysteine peptidase [Ferruginibacter sp.]
MMKKLLMPFFLLLVTSVHAQFNNSWIDYNKTYYKFRIAKDTLCRIPQSALATAGLDAVNADQFQLWRNGVQIRIYTSTTGAPLGASDYIEFWGEMNDGKPDKQLYRDQTFQLADRYSLETDTVAYFLTVNPSGGNLRYTSAANPSPGAATPDPYFMRKIDRYYKMQINRGLARVVGEYVYSAAYDEGEGWSSFDIAYGPGNALAQEFFDLNVYTAGPPNSLSVRVNAFGNADNVRSLRVKIFNNVVYSNPMPFFSSARVDLNNLPLTLLQSPAYVPIYAEDSTTVITDRIVVTNIGITYPATFNFNNQRNFYFELEPSATGNYLLIDNVNFGTVAPILYDMTSGSRYIGDIVTTPGKVGFVLPASGASVRQLMLINQEPANVNIIRNFTQRNFLDFGTTALQGDYLIISNPALYNDGSGNNYVDQYRQYHNTLAGGSFNTKVYDIGELTDQFGFGIKGHPGAIRDFIRYSNQQFAVKPKYVFLIGRGMNYMEQKAHESDPLSDKLNFIPTFGWPASDVLLASEPGTTLPIIPIGRLSVINGTEINNYLQKVMQYNQVQQTPSPTIADKAWMKDMIHVAGGKTVDESFIFKAYMDSYKEIVENDTLYGGHVETFAKTGTGAVEQANSQRIEQLFDNGIGFIGYFGHSSASTFEFNLSDPQIYTNTGKYPFFNVSGCSAGNFFIFDQLRLTGNLSLSEKYVLANQRGSIGFLADTHFGIPPFLNFYNLDFYTSFCRTLYGNTVGNQIKNTILSRNGGDPNVDYYTRVHLEEVTLHGDPAIKINAFDKPDYVIEDQLVKISPSIISVADNNFNVKIKMANIGRATHDSIWISVKRKLPNDTIRVLVDSIIPAMRYMDSLNLTVPINPVTDKGLNQLIITLDYTNRVDESFETNNTLTKDFYIFEDELRPSYPYNFSIVNTQNITFVANTANPLSGQRDYVMELDTTELFNSAFKKIYNKSGIGGIEEFTPTNITFTDSTVYYWRVAIVPTGTAPYIWNSFSFIYLPNSSTGFNQSHYYQHLKDNYTNINLGTDRKFSFQQVPRNLTIRTGLYPFFSYDKINVNLDFDQLELYGCKYNSIQFYVFDSTTLMPWDNRNVTFSGSTPTGAMFGSWPVCQNSAITDTTRRFFEFPYGTASYRKSAMDFLDNPLLNGMYIAITNLGNKNSNTSFINQWKDDTLTLGSGNSLYHKLKSIGFTQIDSFTSNKPFLYFFRKGVSAYTPTQLIGPKDSSYIDQTFGLNTTKTSGIIESPVYGPAARWTALHWRGSTSDPLPVDKVSVEVWGIKADGTADSLTTVAPAQDTSLAFINAAIYPNIKLRMYNSDSIYATPHQLRYLRVNADYVPEGAVAPNILFKMKDSVEQGETIDFALAFKNISQTKFDSTMKIKFSITDRNNLTTPITIPRGKILLAGDTLSVHYTIDTRNYPGNNILFVEFNPDNDQREQYHYNNVLYKGFYVKEDRVNPLLDVTFDGIHILNKDIVSAKPFILIKLKDESHLELKDTSLLKVMIRYPGDPNLHTYSFGDTMRFIPANIASGENTATIELRPYLQDSPADEPYELIVTGKDVVGNKAGELDYHITFSVINTPMISNMLNYPNPFTTSTAFVFTVTGSEVPQNIRIQILTITGKIVREILKDELGPIHIGRNITEFKWDGTDMYGQKLANGVYIYRVLTNLNGKKLDKFDTFYENGRTNTNKLFNKGYGKMYLMR